MSAAEPIRSPLISSPTRSHPLPPHPPPPHPPLSAAIPFPQMPTLSWLDLPDDIKHLMILSANSWDNSAEAEKYLHQALEQSNDNLDVLTAAYRYFFYRNNTKTALQIAERVIDQVKLSESLPDDWEQLEPVLIDRKDEPSIRLYISAYAAYGYLLAKSGNLEQAITITSRIAEIDDRKEFSAAVIHTVLTTPPEDDD